jgi:hypothetical protein
MDAQEVGAKSPARKFKKVKKSEGVRRTRFLVAAARRRVKGVLQKVAVDLWDPLKRGSSPRTSGRRIARATWRDGADGLGVALLTEVRHID